MQQRKRQHRKRKTEKPEEIIHEISGVIIDGMNLYKKAKRLLDKRKGGKHDRVKTKNPGNKG